jgi:hypothetical protein
MSSLWRRIAAVERKHFRRRKPPARAGRSPATAEEWLAYFEAMGREGCFCHEPDFPRALAFYREAIRDPTGPVYYRFAGQPRLLPESNRGRPFVRVDGAGNVIPDGQDVSRGVLFPVTSAADEGWQWLCGMALRVRNGVPPVTEAEFRELTDWLSDVLGPADRAAFSAGLIDVGTAGGGGYQTTPCNLWMTMRNEGPRGANAGGQAEAARRLRARFGMTPTQHVPGTPG